MRAVISPLSFSGPPSADYLPTGGILDGQGCVFGGCIQNRNFILRPGSVRFIAFYAKKSDYLLVQPNWYDTAIGASSEAGSEEKG